MCAPDILIKDKVLCKSYGECLSINRSFDGC